MSGANGIPPGNRIPLEIPKLGGSPQAKLTLFELNVVNKLGAIATALYGLTVQMEAGRMQAAPLSADGPPPTTDEINATAKHAQDVATLALNLAGVMPLVEKLGAQEAGQ